MPRVSRPTVTTEDAPVARSRLPADDGRFDFTEEDVAPPKKQPARKQLAPKRRRLEANAASVKALRRAKPGERSMQEIRHHQKGTELLVPRLAINRLIREIAQENSKIDDVRFEAEAIDALHTAAEGYLIEVMDDANKVAVHCKRQTIAPKDMRLALQIRDEEPTESKAPELPSARAAARTPEPRKTKGAATQPPVARPPSRRGLYELVLICRHHESQLRRM
eukprot:6976043-Prymnesium_polylepis.2